MKTLIATIRPDNEELAIFFDSTTKTIFVENGDTVDEIGYKPADLQDAVDAIREMYRGSDWHLDLVDLS